MKLEVGKKYRTRDGQEVEITSHKGSGRYPFAGSIVGACVSLTWKEDGQYWTTHPCRFDLVSEITDQPASITRHIALVQRKGRYKVRAFKSRELAQVDPTYQSGVDVTLYVEDDEKALPYV